MYDVTVNIRIGVSIYYVRLFRPNLTPPSTLYALFNITEIGKAYGVLTPPPPRCTHNKWTTPSTIIFIKRCIVVNGLNYLLVPPELFSNASIRVIDLNAGGSATVMHLM
jgi:hypothetical protein